MMRTIRISFFQMLTAIKGDFMLFAACLAPMAAGFFFKLGIPMIESLLCRWLQKSVCLAPYYSLIDLLFVLLAPVMFCFVTAMVILEERDDHITNYLFVTTLGIRGYLVSRIGLPALAGFGFTAVLLPFFSLTARSLPMTLLLAAGGALQGIIIALLIVAISANKLEGMAVTKLSTLMLLGAAIPYFIHSEAGYLLGFLPAFWMGKAVSETAPVFMVPALLTAFIWITLLQKIFVRKITS